MQETLLLTQRLQDVARASGDWAWETDERHRSTWVHGASLGVRQPAIGDLIPAGKVARYIQMETKIRSLVRFDLAANVPLVP